MSYRSYLNVLPNRFQNTGTSARFHLDYFLQVGVDLKFGRVMQHREGDLHLSLVRAVEGEHDAVLLLGSRLRLLPLSGIDSYRVVAVAFVRKAHRNLLEERGESDVLCFLLRREQVALDLEPVVASIHVVFNVHAQHLFDLPGRTNEQLLQIEPLAE